MGSMKRTLAEARALKSFDFTRSGVSDAFSVLLDHLVRSRQHVGRDCQADLLAAFRLMMNSNLVGCSTGISAGLVPLRILSTIDAMRL